MSTQPDARADLQDPQLAQWYHAGGGPEPSPALDQAILAAAHRGVQARPRAAGSVLRRWRVPLSLAAVVVLSVTVVTLVSEHGVELADTGAPPRPAERAPQSADATRTQPQQAESSAPAARTETARKHTAPDALAKRRPDTFVPAPPAPPPAAAPAPVAPPPSLRDALDERAAGQLATEPITGPTESRASEVGGLAAGAPGAAASPSDPERGRQEDARPPPSAKDDTAPAAASLGRKSQALEQVQATQDVAPATATRKRESSPEPAPFASRRQDSAVAEQRSLARPQAAAKPKPPSGEVAQLLKALEHEPPERWLERIEALRRAGRNAEGDELLAAFKKRFPGHSGAATR